MKHKKAPVMTKKTDTWMPLLVDKYLGDTTDLTTEQHGAYLLLLMSMWKKGGSLPNVDEALMTITHLKPARWKAHKAVLMGFFRVDEDGQLRQKRLSQELQRAQKSTEAKAEAGAKGAAKRWQTDGKPDGKPDGEAISETDGKPPDKPDGEPVANDMAAGMANGSQTPWRNDASIHTPSSSLRSEERAPATAEVEQRSARAPDHEPPPPDPTPRTVTPAAAVCLALKRHGIGSVNPGSPKLQALLEAGATEAEFVGAADRAKGKHDPFSYVLSVVEGQRRDAKELTNGVHHGPLPGTDDPPQPWYETPAGIKAKGAELGMPWSEDGWVNGQHMNFPSYSAAVRRRAARQAEHTT